MTIQEYREDIAVEVELLMAKHPGLADHAMALHVVSYLSSELAIARRQSDALLQRLNELLGSDESGLYKNLSVN